MEAPSTSTWRRIRGSGGLGGAGTMNGARRGVRGARSYRGLTHPSAIGHVLMFPSSGTATTAPSSECCRLSSLNRLYDPCGWLLWTLATPSREERW